MLAEKTGKRYTQGMLAERLGLSVTSIVNWEAGEHRKKTTEIPVWFVEFAKPEIERELLGNDGLSAEVLQLADHAKELEEKIRKLQNRVAD